MDATEKAKVLWKRIDERNGAVWVKQKDNVDQQTAGVSAELTIIPMKGSWLSQQDQPFPSSRSVTALNYCGISFSTIVWSAHYVSLSAL